MSSAGRLTRRGSRVLLCATLVIGGGACNAKNVYLTNCAPLAELICTTSEQRAPESVVASVFLVGDAGEPDESSAVVKTRDLLLARLNDDLRTSRRLNDGHNDVRIAFLGDNIYPVGLRECAEGYCPEDQEQLDAQIRAVPDSVAVYFVAGNHDWGNTTGDAAYELIANQGEFLETRDTLPTTRPLALWPPAGCPGPVADSVRVAGRTRLVLIFVDTQWLLLPKGHRPDLTCPHKTEEEVYRGLRSLLEGAGETPVLFLAHHPVRTYSSHGGHGGGLAKLAHLLGWSVQDLNSGPYLRLIDRLEGLFDDFAAPQTRAPIMFAAGHDHALQVMRDDATRVHHLVSGSGSKLSEVGSGEDSRFSAGLPGYMRLDIHEDGQVLLSVTAGCPPKDSTTDTLGKQVDHDGGLVCRVGDFEVAFVERLN